MHIPTPLPYSEAFLKLVNDKVKTRQDSLRETDEGRWLSIASTQDRWSEALETSLLFIVEQAKNERADDRAFSEWMLIGRSASLLCKPAVFKSFLSVLHHRIILDTQNSTELVARLFALTMPYNNWETFRSFVEEHKLPLKDGVFSHMVNHSSNDLAMNMLIGRWLHSDTEYFSYAASMEMYLGDAMQNLHKVKRCTDTGHFVGWSSYVLEVMQNNGSTENINNRRLSSIMDQMLGAWVLQPLDANHGFEATALHFFGVVACHEKAYVPQSFEEYKTSGAFLLANAVLYNKPVDDELQLAASPSFLMLPLDSCSEKLCHAWLRTPRGISQIMGMLWSGKLSFFLDQANSSDSECSNELRRFLEHAWLNDDTLTLLRYVWERYGKPEEHSVEDLLSRVQLIQSLYSDMNAAQIWRLAISDGCKNLEPCSLPNAIFTDNMVR